jgi:formylglycine-generating enzyme required for sulfatase activity
MGTKALFGILTIALALPAGVDQAAAEGTQFLRIVGPTETFIASFNADGSIAWSNAQPGATYIVQTVSSLPGGTNWVDYVQIPVSQSVNTNQIVAFNPPVDTAFIPADLFTIGDTLDGESDASPTNVYVSAFYMDVNLVSFGRWQTIYNWATNQGYGFDNAGFGKATNHPVSVVNWYDCVKWCNARSQQAGLTPVYYVDTNLTRVYTNGDSDAVYPDWTASGYRLPTEAEWEKAARGGLNGQRFPWGDTISESQANYFADTSYYGYDLGPSGFNATYATGGDPYTSPVGSFAPNGYGLYDMAGNLFEWCWDWYEGPPAYPGGPPYPPAGSPYAGGIDPRGPSLISGDTRVERGGDWIMFALYARCADRNSLFPNEAAEYMSFRCARGL